MKPPPPRPEDVEWTTPADEEKKPVRPVAPKKAAASVSASWGRINACLAENAPGLAEQMNPTTSLNVVAWAEEPLSCYFEFAEGVSSKFWEVSRDGDEMTTRYGKIGTKGQSTTKAFAGPEETARIIARQVEEGYVKKPR